MHKWMKIMAEHNKDTFWRECMQPARDWLIHCSRQPPRLPNHNHVVYVTWKGPLILFLCKYVNYLMFSCNL